MSSQGPSGNEEPEPTPDVIFGTLDDHERRWVDRQQFLAAHGYMLRKRYRSGWVPSWRGTEQHPTVFEDSVVLPLREHLIDAVKTSDEKLVYIKRIRSGDNESQIATMLSSEPLRNDPRNHCVPVLDIFKDDDDETVSYMIMPFLRALDDPPLELVDELIIVADQLLEGLVFLHEQGVAHRDCSLKNLMMDASPMYPQGFHPVKDLFLPDAQTPAVPLSRSTVPIKYYYVDFGISLFFPPEEQNRLAVGDAGRDQEVPELSARIPYDPFKVDVFILGNVLRREFQDKYWNLDFLDPLISAMTRRDPAARPSAEEALRQWGGIRQSLGVFQRRWALVPRDANWASVLVINVASSVTATLYLVKRLLGWTTELQG